MQQVQDWDVEKFYQVFRSGSHVKLVWEDGIIDDVIKRIFDFGQEKQRGHYGIDIEFRKHFIELLLDCETNNLKIYDSEFDRIYPVQCFVLN